MPRTVSRVAPLIAISSAVLLWACDAAAPAPVGPATTAAPALSPTVNAPTLTPVPGGATGAPASVPARAATVQTEWGEALAVLPDTFPRFPGSAFVDLPEAATAFLSADVDVATAAGWYADELGARGYQVDASDVLEDGGLVLDVRSDLPECRIRVDFRPAGDSTIIGVLYGSGCAGLGG